MLVDEDLTYCTQVTNPAPGKNPLENPFPANDRLAHDMIAIKAKSLKATHNTSEARPMRSALLTRSVTRTHSYARVIHAD